MHSEELFTAQHSLEKQVLAMDIHKALTAFDLHDTYYTLDIYVVEDENRFRRR